MAAVFDRIRAEVETIDILVNGVWGGYDDMIEDGCSQVFNDCSSS